MKKKALKWILGAAIGIAAVTGCCMYPSAAERSNVLPDGVMIEGMDMSGKTPEEALAAVAEMVEEAGRKQLTVTDGEASLSMTMAQAGLTLKNADEIEAACHTGLSGNYIQRFKEISDADSGNKVFSLELTCDQEVLCDALKQCQDQVACAPEDAVIVRKNGQFIITPEKQGRQMDIEKTAAAVTAAVIRSWRKDAVTAPLEAVYTEPDHTQAELSVIQDELGAYETSFAGSSSGRIANIKNGAAKLENHVVYPGEEFSFLELARPFNAANGYALAGTYVNGRNTPGMGGGICQVSSTLYNAVLRAELTVTERTNHMMTVGYVPLGADATIANPYTDFKFKNESGYPVLIEAYTYGTMLYVRIYGKEERPADRTIEFITVTEQTIYPGADVITYDSTMPTGEVRVDQNAHTGYVAAFYKNIYIHGKLTDQILINRSQYGAYPRYITKGSA